MNRFTVEKKLYSLHDRISRAYHDYGRLCSAHPISCLSICILSMVFLSAPAISRVKLPVSSPMDVFWTTKQQIESNQNETNAPEWLLLEPAAYIQQIVLSASVDPWDNVNMTTESAVKGPLSRSFHILDHVVSVKVNGHGFESVCLPVKSRPNSFAASFLPSTNCLVLSPALFWNSDRILFQHDDDVIGTIFDSPCTTSMCPRDILLGAPTRLTGIKPSYQTNRHRTIETSVTLIQSKYDSQFRKTLVENLKKEFELQQSTASDENIFIHVFYIPRKYFNDYLPLFSGYFLCMIYFYYTVSKFEMVKSKWGLAFAAFNTVFWTLTMTSGICAHFDLTPTFFGAGLFPYLAMIIGLENVLCITRAVVYTTPSMDVASRLSHGLSHEGYYITKFFLLEMTFLGFAWLTFVPEIQEFCTFAFIALVVDFYMQLFFYIPCLLFDLARLGPEEKQKFSQMLFNSDIRKLKNYPIPKCPARLIFPRMFAKKQSLFRTSSEIKLTVSETKTHRRTHSTDKAAQILKTAGPISYRLRVLYFWTRTRFVQRFVMAFFVIWVFWMAFLMHKWKLLDKFHQTQVDDPNYIQGFGVSQHILDTAPLEWVHWQRQTFKWWPAVFGEYNLSISGHYVTFLPPIVLKAKIPPEDWSLQKLPKSTFDRAFANKISGFTTIPGKEPELQTRITFLERQMTTLLVTSVCLPFCSVVAFILYVFFWDRWRQYRASLRKTENIDPPKTLTQKCFVELTPLVFSNHNFVVECVAVQLPSTIVFSSLEGRVYVCGAQVGEPKLQLARWKGSVNVSATENQNDGLRDRSKTLTNPGTEPTSEVQSRTRTTTESETSLICDAKTQIWSLTIKHNVILLGCADGSVEVAKKSQGRVIGRYEEPAQSNSGVIQIKIKSNRMVIGRLNGIIDLVEMTFTENPDQAVEFSLLGSVKAHERPISAMECAGLYLFSASYDRLIKVYDIRTMKLIYTLIEDDSAVMELKIDEQIDAPLVLYNRYESGLICSWDVESGELIRSMNQLQKSGTPKAQLGITSSFLIAFSEDGQLFLWSKFTGEFLIRLVANSPEKRFDETPGKVVVLEDQLIATSVGCFVQVWDLSLRALIRQIQLPNAIENLYTLDGRSILCVAAPTIYRVDIPLPKKSN